MKCLSELDNTWLPDLVPSPNMSLLPAWALFVSWQPAVTVLSMAFLPARTLLARSFVEDDSRSSFPCSLVVVVVVVIELLAAEVVAAIVVGEASASHCRILSKFKMKSRRMLRRMLRLVLAFVVAAVVIVVIVIVEADDDTLRP